MMKHVMMWCLFLLMAPLAMAQDAGTEPAKIVFLGSSLHDFGEIKQGAEVQWVFEFENRGKAPLVLTNVSTTCGCTVPEWPRQPILHGGKGKITVRFNSAGKIGMQNKVITIYSNAVNNAEPIKIRANILAAD